jgi:hypothetical protein
VSCTNKRRILDMSMRKNNRYTPCSLGLSATSQQYFSLRTNQQPATSQQYFSLRTNQHQPSATSQTNRPINVPSLLYLVRFTRHTKRKESNTSIKMIYKSTPFIFRERAELGLDLTKKTRGTVEIYHSRHCSNLPAPREGFP